MLEIGHLQNSNLYKAAALYELCAATTIPHFSFLISHCFFLQSMLSYVQHQIRNATTRNSNFLREPRESLDGGK